MPSPQADHMFYIIPRSHNFSTTVFNCFKHLQKARCGARAVTQFYKSESRPFSTELSVDRATSVNGQRRSRFLFLNGSLTFWAALVDREWPWAAKNGRSIKTQLLEWRTWQIAQYTENPLWIYKLQNSSWHSIVLPQAKESWFIRSSDPDYVLA